MGLLSGGVVSGGRFAPGSRETSEGRLDGVLLLSYAVPVMRVQSGVLRLVGRALQIHPLRVDGEDEFGRFLEGFGYHDPRAATEVKFLRRVFDVLQVVADTGEACSTAYLRHLSGWGPIWEIRISQCRVNHRLYGFMMSERAFCMVSYRDKRDDRPGRKVLAHVAEVRATVLASKTSLLLEDEHDE